MLEVREHTPRAVADIVPALAREFLVAPDPPWHMPTVRELGKRHRSSISSIHVAIARLREAGSIEVETRGPLGTFMVARSLGGLWRQAEGGPMVVALPLASSPQYEALATAIKQLLTTSGLDVFLIFVRGSRQRLHAVRERRCDLAVMSDFAASELCGRDDATIVELEAGSYNTGHRVFYPAAATDGHPMRVIVDQLSADQQLLTALEFGDTVQLVPAMTGQIARMLAEGQGDAAIWTADEMQVNRPPGILDRPLSDHVRERLGGRETRAVLVGRAADAEVLRGATRAVVPEDVTRIQRAVMAGEIVPEY
jgi:hypothetical protein